MPSCSSNPSAVVCRSGGVITPGVVDQEVDRARPRRPSVSPRAATESSDDRSRSRRTTSAPGRPARIVATAASPLARLRTGMITSAPAAASAGGDAEAHPVAGAGDDGAPAGQVGEGEVDVPGALWAPRWSVVPIHACAGRPAIRIQRPGSIRGYGVRPMPVAAMARMIDRTGLAEFLRRRRESLQPEDVGLPRGQRAAYAAGCGARRSPRCATCRPTTTRGSSGSAVRSPRSR